MASVRRLVTLAALAALATATPAALAGDIIVLSGGSKLGNSKSADPPKADDFGNSTLEIVDETLEAVTYRLEGVPQIQSQQMSGIRAIHHDPSATPADLARGRDLLERGDAAAARDALARVAKDGSAPQWAKSEGAYRLAVTFLAEGNAAEAEKQLGAFKTQNPKSRWVKEATNDRARALMSLDKVDDAKKEFLSLKSLPGVSEADGAFADFWVAWIDEQVATKRDDQAGLAAALKAYKALTAKLQGKAAFEVVYRRCQAGEASCLIALGKPAEAKEILERLVPDLKDPVAKAVVYNKLGVATWRVAPADKTQLKAALLCFLRVVSLYGDEPGAEEDCAESMFRAGELFRELKAEGPDYAARARREWNEVIAQFPGSVWAQKAKQALIAR